MGRRGAAVMEQMNRESLYFEWLYSCIGNPADTNPERSRRMLAGLLYAQVFFPYIPNDSNRAVDGKALRTRFGDSIGIWIDDEFAMQPCSFLEMLIALSFRAAFDTNGDHEWWFWKMLENAKIPIISDSDWCEEDSNEVIRVVDHLNRRLYMPNGKYGLFPLSHPRGDQRKVELWYQMAAYLEEHFPET